MSDEPQYTNRLIGESSPYLLQHAHNPVDWHPWGPEALALAKRDNKPIFLSIGYSACHWCHVMEHESFENPEIARIMNEHFVCIKVDREERPDLDEIYMKAVMMLNHGQGGWPMSVWLTPDLKPFYGGTYFPPDDRFGRPGFPRILTALAETWQKDKGRVLQSADKIVDYLEQMVKTSPGEGELNHGLIDRTAQALQRGLDRTHGGFGGAPKFPHSMDLALLLRHWKRTGAEDSLHAVTLTLDKMARGGMYDQLGGGFHRYSVDAQWLVPHFEKMLYDNALLTVCYLEGYQATGNEFYARIARETLDYLLRDMLDEAGGIHSTEDADSEGHEGKFYVWTVEEVRAGLGDELGPLLCRYWDVTKRGNFEGKNILHVTRSADEFAQANNLVAEQFKASLLAAREKLLVIRSPRIRPGKDDKILAGWNGLAISAFANGYQVLSDARYLTAAQNIARFVLTKMRQPDGRLFRTYRHGQAKLNAYLNDYAFLLVGLLDLYEADFDPHWIDEAQQLVKVLEQEFWDDQQGGFFFTGSSHERLLLRSKDPHDGAIPSGNSYAVLGLLRLADLTGSTAAAELARRTLQWQAPVLAQGTGGTSQMLCALDYFLATRQELALVGPADHPATQSVLAHLRRQFHPHRVVAYHEGPAVPAAVASVVPLLSGKSSLNGNPRFFLCQNFACQAPETEAEKFLEAVR